MKNNLQFLIDLCSNLELEFKVTFNNHTLGYCTYHIGDVLWMKQLQEEFTTEDTYNIALRLGAKYPDLLKQKGMIS